MLEKIFKIIIWIFAIIGIITSFYLIYQNMFISNYYEFNFIHGDDNNPINGDVYLDKLFLGSTEQGILVVHKENLTSGNLILQGNYNNQPFELIFNFDDNWINENAIEYIAYNNNFFFEFIFTLEDKPIDGDLYLNKIYLGKTNNGKIKANVLDLNNGNLKFKGNYDDEKFKLYFNFDMDYLEKGKKEFKINKQDLFFEFNFLLKDKDEKLDGEVYLNNIFLGETTNGKLNLNILNLTSGNINFKGNYNDKNFDLLYNFELDLSRQLKANFITTYEEIEKSSFDAKDLNLRQIEKEILDLVNKERKKYPAAGIRELRWNEDISDIARAHSKDMLEKQYFSHKTLTDTETLETIDFTQRLKNANIFYLVSNENLILLSVNSETNIAQESVNGWLGSPGHRSTLLDLDNLYSDAGVGIACEKNLCYVTMNFISLRRDISTSINQNSCWRTTIFDEAYEYELPIIVNLQLNSNERIDAHITTRDQFQNCISQDEIISTKSYFSQRNIDDYVLINKGDILLISTKEDIDLDVIIEYIIT